MGQAAPLPAYAGGLRRNDPDRFLTALFAPPARRDALMLLYAFNTELARARAVTSQPALALIRLHWWREVVEGARRQHEIATPLAAALDAGALARADLLAMIDGREAEADPSIATLSAWHDYVRATAGGVAIAAGRALGAEGAALERIGHLGTAYGVAGLRRSVVAMAAQGRCLLPEDLLGAHGLTADDVVARPLDGRLAPVLRELGQWGRAELSAGAGRIPRPVIAAALPGVLARRDLRRSPPVPLPRGLGDRLAVAITVAWGRIR